MTWLIKTLFYFIIGLLLIKFWMSFVHSQGRKQIWFWKTQGHIIYYPIYNNIVLYMYRIKCFILFEWLLHLLEIILLYEFF